MRIKIPVILALCCAVTTQAEKVSTNTAPVVRVTARQPTRVDIASPTDSTFISGEDIERSQAASVPELLAKEANILFRSSTGKSSEGQVAMRGFGDNSGLRVLVEVDGHKINRPDMGTIDWNQIPIANIAYIEVLRGGNNVLYGNHALAGVIKITTRKGGDPRLYLRAVQGSHDFEQYSALAVGGADKWYADAGASYLRDKGFRTNSLSWSKNAHASIGRYIGDGSLTLRAALGENYTQFPGPLIKEQMERDPTQSSNLGDQEIFSTNGLFTLLWEGDHDWGKTGLRAGYNVTDSQWSLGGIYARNQSQGFSLRPRIQFGAEETHLILGWDFFYDKLKHDQLTAPTNGELKGWAELDRFTTAPYVFAQHEVVEHLILSGGARYETARTKTRYVEYDFTPKQPSTIDTSWGSEDNPAYDPDDTFRTIDRNASYDGEVTKDGWAAEASLLWQPIGTLSLWVGYDRVYRYPVLDETAAYQGFPLSKPFNEELDPETGDNFETGIKYSDEHFIFSLTGFYLALDDEILFDSQTNLNVNIGPTERLGAEVEAGYNAKYGGLSARAAFVDARFLDGPNTGKTVPLVPWAHGVVSAWVEPVKYVRFTGYYTYVGSQFQGNDYANKLDRLNDYGLFGARIDLMPTEKITLFFKADNILNEEYASSAYTGGYYPGAGQTFQLGLTLEL